jgi:hypothetical protein
MIQNQVVEGGGTRMRLESTTRECSCILTPHDCGGAFVSDQGLTVAAVIHCAQPSIEQPLFIS